MKLKTGYKILASLSALFGLILIISMKSSTVGNVINRNEIYPTATALWGGFFIIAGLL